MSHRRSRAMPVSPRAILCMILALAAIFGMACSNWLMHSQIPVAHTLGAGSQVASVQHENLQAAGSQHADSKAASNQRATAQTARAQHANTQIASVHAQSGIPDDCARCATPNDMVNALCMLLVVLVFLLFPRPLGAVVRWSRRTKSGPVQLVRSSGDRLLPNFFALGVCRI